MIVRQSPIQLNSRWNRACALLLAITALPILIAHAQDYEAVAKRLRSAVEAGELTGPQARAMLEVLKKTANGKEAGLEGRVKASLENVRKELGAAVKEGKISEEDASKRFEAAAKAAKERMAAARDGAPEQQTRGIKRARVYLTKMKEDLAAAVKAGKISEEAAAKRMESAQQAIRKRMAAARDQKPASESELAPQVREYLMNAKRDLGAAVKAGKISEADAIKKFDRLENAVKKKVSALHTERDAKHEADEELSRAGIKIREAVSAGKMTAEEGRAKMDAIRNKLAEPREGGARKNTRGEFGRAVIEIRKAVAAGKISEEDARAKLGALKKRIGEQRERGAKRNIDWDGIKRRIEAAVEAGKLTREQADAKYMEIRKRASGQHDR